MQLWQAINCRLYDGSAIMRLWHGGPIGDECDGSAIVATGMAVQLETSAMAMQLRDCTIRQFNCRQCDCGNRQCNCALVRLGSSIGNECDGSCSGMLKPKPCESQDEVLGGGKASAAAKMAAAVKDPCARQHGGPGRSQRMHDR